MGLFRLRPIIQWICIVVLSLLFVQLLYADRLASTSAALSPLEPGQHQSQTQQTTLVVPVPPPPSDIQLDSRLPVQTFSANSNFLNVNAKFGSRFTFTISPSIALVASGTDGVFHDNAASYSVGIAPTGEQRTFIFHMGSLDSAYGDAYLLNEHWIQGLDTTRWIGDAADGSGMRITVDFIDTFLGEPGCIAIAQCAAGVQDDTVPVLIVGVSLQNNSTATQSGNFLFGSNRKLPASNACIEHTTTNGTSVNLLSYDPAADAARGTLFMAGTQQNWSCNTTSRNRAGLAWNYSVAAAHTSTAYLILGAWNASQNLFVNPQQPANCQHEGLYSAQEWSSENTVVDFAVDNLTAGDRLLGRAQAMENILLNNTVLTAEQRWVIGDTLRSYKASSWLTGSRSCVGSYDASVYEGTYGFLTTVDVMHEYGYFEINRIPWFFKSAMSIVFKNATRDAFGTYFQHDQGGDVDGGGNCVRPGNGIPTIRATCYAPPHIPAGLPMPVEENDNAVLLSAYYVYLTGDTAFAASNISLLDAAMAHNVKVADPSTGIAYNAQGTATTYDAANDCLRNHLPGAGNLYYQGLKEATGYRAVAYLDELVAGGNNASTWLAAAGRIENALVQEYTANGFIPLAQNTNVFSNCDGRSVVLGEGLFYLHLIGQDGAMNQTLLQDLAKQYPADLSADTLSNPTLIAVTSTRATGPQCSTNDCLRYEWFSKVMLSSLIADTVYTAHGCTSCRRLNVTQQVYAYNQMFNKNFGDGLYDDGSDWGGHFYPRGVISWAFLSAAY